MHRSVPKKLGSLVSFGEMFGVLNGQSSKLSKCRIDEQVPNTYYNNVCAKIVLWTNGVRFAPWKLVLY